MNLQEEIRSKAEEKFAATQRKAERALSEQEQERKKLEERTQKLRALRLAKEAADKKAASKD